MHVLRKQAHHLAVQAFVVLAFSYIDTVAFHIGSDYEDRVLVAAYPQALSLPESEELGAFVLSRDNSPGVEPVAGLFLVMASAAVGFGGKDYVGIVVGLTEQKEFFIRPAFHRTGEDFLLADVLDGVGVVLGEDFDHFSFDAFEFLLKENRQVHFAHKAYSLGVLSVGGRQVRFLGQTAHLTFAQVPDGEDCRFELFLTELAEEITLVLARVHSLEKADSAVRIVPSAAIVSGGYSIGSEPSGSLEEGVEFDFPVAEHVRVGVLPRSYSENM